MIRLFSPCQFNNEIVLDFGIILPNYRRTLRCNFGRFINLFIILPLSFKSFSPYLASNLTNITSPSAAGA